LLASQSVSQMVSLVSY